MSRRAQRTFFIIVGIVLTLLNPAFERLEAFAYLTIGAIQLFSLLYGGYLWARLKNRHWGWMFTMCFWPLGLIVLILLKDKSEQLERNLKMPFIEKARTGTGCFVQIIGGILWVGSGLAAFIWALYVLFETFGAWTILIGLLLAPITYLAAVFIVWFSTGIFPVIVLILWLASWVGAGIAYIGSRISGED